MITYKDYLEKISLDEIKQHYDKENRTLPEAGDYFKVSPTIFLRILRYYNFHKSKESHTDQIKKSKLQRYGDSNYNNQEQRAKTNIEKYGVDWVAKSDIVKENIKEAVKETFQEKYGCDNYHMNRDLSRVSVKKLERLFENSDNLEQDVTDYLKKNILDPAVQIFTKTVDHIFNCGVLDEIIDLVNYLSN